QRDEVRSDGLIKKTAANHAPRRISPPALGNPFFRQSTESGYSSIEFFCWSCGRPQQFGQPNEVVGCHGQGELEPLARNSAQHRPGKPADCLAPADWLLGQFVLCWRMT